jgi:hypothetical protein
MSQLKHPNQTRVWEPFVGLVIFVIVVVYLVNVFNTGNWFWFQNNAVNVRPSRIIIIDHGQRTILTQGHEGYEELANASEQALSQLSNTDLVTIGLSDQTLLDYDTNSLILELYFEQPITFNTMARTGEPTQLLIPIEGRHAGGGYVFRGDKGDWWFGAIRMANPDPIFTILNQLGYSVTLNQPASS